MIIYGGMKVGNSPYIAKAFDVNAIRVGEIPDGILGKPVTFTGESLVNILMFNFMLFVIVNLR